VRTPRRILLAGEEKKRKEMCATYGHPHDRVPRLSHLDSFFSFLMPDREEKKKVMGGEEEGRCHEERERREKKVSRRKGGGGGGKFFPYLRGKRQVGEKEGSHRSWRPAARTTCPLWWVCV
jgi:hypothetical protein